MNSGKGNIKIEGRQAKKKRVEKMNGGERKDGIDEWLIWKKGGVITRGGWRGWINCRRRMGE